jgi:hypothetical protein
MKVRSIGKACQHSARKLFDAQRSAKASALPEKARQPKRSAAKNAWHNWLLQKYPF